MARTMKDVQLLFDVLSGHDEADPIGASTPRRTPNFDELKQYPIGVFEDDGLIPVTPETRAAVRDAAKALKVRDSMCASTDRDRSSLLANCGGSFSFVAGSCCLSLSFRGGKRS